MASKMWTDDYQWHYDYVRLAWDTGFSFEKCKNPNLDKNQIGIADVDRIVKERDVGTVDRYISTVVQYILEDEQAKVLDVNFVKMFRLSQLAVEYLLFCKKYLDNTVVLLKKELAKNQDESKELKTYISELESHLDTISKQHALSTYKCTSCYKAFSSEEYLKSHIKRRHENQNTQIYNAETDKLNSEIKELKERLNAAEKLLKEKNEQMPEKNMFEMDNTSSKVSELLDKFEQFKHQVDTEMKDLKLQKSFYEQNYAKLFELAIQNKENVEPKSDAKDTLKSETAIQTDRLLNIESVIDKNVLEIKDIESGSDSDKTAANQAANLDLIKETIESKMTTSLAGIENQMQAFWEKLVQIEQSKYRIQESVITQQDISGDAYDVKPRVKPRSKLTNTIPNPDQQANNNEREKLRQALEELEQRQEDKKAEVNGSKSMVVEPVIVKRELKRAQSVKVSSDSSESDSDSTSSEDQCQEELLENHKRQESKRVEAALKSVSTVPIKSKTHGKRRHLITENQEDASARKSPLPTLEETTENVVSAVAERLQDLGISQTWKRIPVRSFEKALEIINHQAILSKKTYPNFDKIKRKIQNDIDNQTTKESMKNRPELDVVTLSSPKRKPLQNIVRVSYRPKSGKRSPPRASTSPKHAIPEIKNRSLYDTDTESEQHIKANQERNISGKSDILPVYSQM
ncbi:cilium assembly protein DZIP1 isoform X2 [Anthonomus grandis grandis]|uniref:cilium assembly protein DZIP1 isoform X2 n=1 Tax=Anthonomus grandis grandis TaxID=2921223 RepID=UPI00216594B9|nr:cilium assembly protein DZIP1 isoform X2 [Anthonomus grandis grandis]